MWRIIIYVYIVLIPYGVGTKCRMLRGMCIFWPCTVFFLLPLLSSLFIIRWRFRIFLPNSHFEACGRQLKKLYYHCSHVVSVTHYITCPLRPLERICLLFCNRCSIFFAINEATLCFVLFFFLFFLGGASPFFWISSMRLPNAELFSRPSGVIFHRKLTSNYVCNRIQGDVIVGNFLSHLWTQNWPFWALYIILEVSFLILGFHSLWWYEYKTWGRKIIIYWNYRSVTLVSHLIRRSRCTECF